MKDIMICRRMFIKSSAFFAATLLGAKSAFAKLIDEEESRVQDDVLLENALKESALKESDLQDGGIPEGKLSLFNTSSRERLTITYRDRMGQYCHDALNSLNWMFRCHNTDETTMMDLRVIEYLNRLDNSLGGNNEIHIISGYRSPAYNAMLRRKSKGVAKDSYHMKGMAIDLQIPGIPLHQIRQTALALAAGGVGYYPQSGFVHIDSGNFRTW